MIDSEIARLCQQIYSRHKAALDLIYEHRPDLQAELMEQIKQLFAEVEAEYGFEYGKYPATKTYFYFYDRQAIDLYNRLLKQGWDIEYWPIYLDVRNRSDKLELRLVLETGNDAAIPQIILDHVQQHPKLFKRTSKRLGNYPSIWRRLILTKSDYEDPDLEAMFKKLQKEWQHFLKQDLPAIWDSLSQIRWDELAKKRDG